MPSEPGANSSTTPTDGEAVPLDWATSNSLGTMVSKMLANSCIGKEAPSDSGTYMAKLLACSNIDSTRGGASTNGGESTEDKSKELAVSSANANTSEWPLPPPDMPGLNTELCSISFES